MNKSLFLIRGLPSSGKSTLADLLSENGTYPVLSADMYFEDSEGNYNFDVTKIKDAHLWCQDRVKQYLLVEDGWFPKNLPYFSSVNKIFVANTFTTEWEMQPYFDLAKKYDYDVFTIIVENRHGNKNNHNVPDETILKMRDRFNIKL
jgi:predicted kinase